VATIRNEKRVSKNSRSAGRNKDALHPPKLQDGGKSGKGKSGQIRKNCLKKRSRRGERETAITKTRVRRSKLLHGRRKARKESKRFKSFTVNLRGGVQGGRKGKELRQSWPMESPKKTTKPILNDQEGKRG